MMINIGEVDDIMVVVVVVAVVVVVNHCLTLQALMMVKSGLKSASSSLGGLMNMLVTKWCCQAISVMKRT